MCLCHQDVNFLVPRTGLWAGKVTAGLAESNVSLPLGGLLKVICSLTACTPGSAPGPTLGNEYGKPLPFYLTQNRSFRRHCSLHQYRGNKTQRNKSSIDTKQKTYCAKLLCNFFLDHSVNDDDMMTLTCPANTLLIL